MRIWVQADVTNLELSKTALLPLKTNQPCRPSPCHLFNNIWSLEQAWQFKESCPLPLVKLAHRHTLPAQCRIVMTLESLNIYTQLEAAFTQLPSPRAFQPLFSASPFSQQNENVKSVLRPTLLGTFTSWVKMWKQVCGCECDIHLLSYLQRYPWSLFQFSPN